MIDKPTAEHTSHTKEPWTLQDHPLHQAIYDLCQQIEKCGASEDLTKAATMAGALQVMVLGLRKIPEQYMNFVIKNGFEPEKGPNGNVYFTMPRGLRDHPDMTTGKDYFNQATMLAIFYEELGISDPEQWVQQQKDDAQAFAEWTFDNCEPVYGIGSNVGENKWKHGSHLFATAELYSGPYAEYKERNKG